jgi:hypothetical protein
MLFQMSTVHDRGAVRPWLFLLVLLFVLPVYVLKIVP